MLDTSVPIEKVLIFVKTIQQRASKMGLKFSSRPDLIMLMEAKTKEEVRKVCELMHEADVELVLMGILTIK